MPITLNFSWENLKQKQLRQGFHLCVLFPPCSRTTSPSRDTASPVPGLCNHQGGQYDVPPPRTFPTPQTGQQSLVIILQPLSVWSLSMVSSGLLPPCLCFFVLQRCCMCSTRGSRKVALTKCWIAQKGWQLHHVCWGLTQCDLPFLFSLGCC